MAGGDGVAAKTPAGAVPAAAGDAPPRTRFLRQFELVERVRAYDPSVDESLINRAYVYATSKHGSQKRHSGDPYFAHPIEVAGILTEYKLDAATIVAGLLHDTIEDTDATRPEIEGMFGPQVADLVEGVTKLSKLEVMSEENKQAQNLQKFILAMSRDVRVLLVKLADRLHNMRTLSHVPNPGKRRRIALETLEIYGPLARRIGMERMARELEKLAFHEAFSEAEAAINARLEQLRLEKGANVAIIIQTIMEVFEFAGIDARVFGREKQPYSIWRKLQRKSVEFRRSGRRYVFRSSTILTIAIAGSSTDRRTDQLRRTSTQPSLLLGSYTVIATGQCARRSADPHRGDGPDRRSRRRRALALQERGLWLHEERAASEGLDAREATRALLKSLNMAATPPSFRARQARDGSDHVFTFTPKGTLIALPQGATPLDFVYAVHSGHRHRCTGVKISTGVGYRCAGVAQWRRGRRSSPEDRAAPGCRASMR
ncbi:MAG: HD domain-containing protein [Hyphomonadaceae bacterium]